MGMWDLKPYDNDAASDLFGELMYETKLRDMWHAKISDPETRPNELRALVWFFIQLGRVYVWPIDNYDTDLELAITKADMLRKDKYLNDIEGLPELLETEYAELVKRKE